MLAQWFSAQLWRRFFAWLSRKGYIRSANQERAVQDIEDLIEVATDPPPPPPGPAIGTPIIGDPNKAAEQLNKIEADRPR